MRRRYSVRGHSPAAAQDSRQPRLLGFRRRIGLTIPGSVTVSRSQRRPLNLSCPRGARCIFENPFELFGFHPDRSRGTRTSDSRMSRRVSGDRTRRVAETGLAGADRVEVLEARLPTCGPRTCGKLGATDLAIRVWDRVMVAGHGVRNRKCRYRVRKQSRRI